MDTTLHYSYDGDGLLANLRWSHGESGIPLPISDGTFFYVNGPDGLPLEQVASTGGVTRFYHRDALGSTRALTTTAGVVAATYDYDPYGRPLSLPSVVNPFGFAGQYTDPDTGLVFMRHRWYDPATGQFLSRDPLGFGGGDQNLYGYVGRNPVNGSDPTGLCNANFVSTSFWTEDNCLYDATTGFVDLIGASASDISLATTILASAAAVIPGGQFAVPVFAAISAATGALAAGDHAADDDSVAALFDILGATSGATGVFERLLAERTLVSAFEAAFKGKSVDELIERVASRRKLAELLDRIGYGSLAASLLAEYGDQPNPLDCI